MSILCFAGFDQGWGKPGWGSDLLIDTSALATKSQGFFQNCKKWPFSPVNACILGFAKNDEAKQIEEWNPTFRVTTGDECRTWLDGWRYKHSPQLDNAVTYRLLNPGLEHEFKAVFSRNWYCAFTYQAFIVCAHHLVLSHILRPVLPGQVPSQSQRQ